MTIGELLKRINYLNELKVRLDNLELTNEYEFDENKIKELKQLIAIYESEEITNE